MARRVYNEYADTIVAGKQAPIAGTDCSFEQPHVRNTNNEIIRKRLNRLTTHFFHDIVTKVLKKRHCMLRRGDTKLIPTVVSEGQQGLPE